MHAWMHKQHDSFAAAAWDAQPYVMQLDDMHKQVLLCQCTQHKLGTLIMMVSHDNNQDL